MDNEEYSKVSDLIDKLGRIPTSNWEESNSQFYPKSFYTVLNGKYILIEEKLDIGASSADNGVGENVEIAIFENKDFDNSKNRIYQACLIKNVDSVMYSRIFNIANKLKEESINLRNAKAEERYNSERNEEKRKNIENLESVLRE